MIRLLVDHLWQSTLFGLAIWSVTLALRGNSAAVRHWLWLAASLKFLVPFSALYLLGTAAGIPPPLESQPVFFAAAMDAASPVIAPASGIEIQPVHSWWNLLFALWLLGAAWCGFRWWREWTAARGLLRASRPALGPLPNVLVTDAPIEPAVAGVFRPRVLIPSTLIGRLSAPRLRAVLAHEREHIARHDNLKAQIHRMVETLFWFHPLVWLIGRQLLEERERACDEAVLGRGHEPRDYAAGILDVCRHCADARPTALASALAGDLPRRIGRILGGPAPAGLGFLKSFTLTASTFLVATLPLYAGIVEGAELHRSRVDRDSRLLFMADLSLQPAPRGAAPAQVVHVVDRRVEIRNVSLRELVALAYGVRTHQVKGRGDWLDAPRFDITAALPEAVSDPEDFDPVALQALANRLLAQRFNIEIHVNRQCQHPCGPRALESRLP